jgi:type I site-specific restriction endonuclease
MDIYEQSRKNIEKLKSDFDAIDKKTLNEANTRFKFIDRLLRECLGWSTADISCEDNYQKKYTDYTLSLFRSVAVVEAKKNRHLL